MKHCPNVDCPHYRAVGSPAEYVADIAVCRDCGAALLLGAAPEPAAEDARAESPVMKRLGITLLAIPALFVMPWISLPGIDRDALAEQLAKMRFLSLLRPSGSFSAFALGLAPLINAAVLVGLGMLAVPRWRRLERDPAGQRKLRVAVLALTLVLAVAQAYGILPLLENLPGVYTGSAPVTVLTFVTGTMLMIGGAELLSRHGLGNGFSILIALGLVGIEIERTAMRFVGHDRDPISPSALAMSIAAPIVAVYALARLLDAKRPVAHGAAREEGPSAYREPAGTPSDDQVIAPPVLRLPASGIGPIAVGASLFTMAGADALHALGLRDLSRILYVGVAPIAILGCLAVAVSLALTFALHPAERLARLAARAKPDDEVDPRAVAIARAALRRAAIRSAALLGAIAALGHLAWRSERSFPAATTLFVLAGVALDLRSEWRARKRSGELATVAVLHDIDAAEAALSALEEAHIAAHARGLRHKSLLQIFGSYVPVEIMVAPDRADEARQIVKPFDGAPEVVTPPADEPSNPRKRRRKKPAEA